MNRYIKLLLCLYVAGAILACSITLTDKSPTNVTMSLEESIERLARASDKRLGW